VTGKDLWDYARRIEDIVLICGRKNVSKKVQETVQFLRNPTKKTGELKSCMFFIDLEFWNLEYNGFLQFMNAVS